MSISVGLIPKCGAAGLNGVYILDNIFIYVTNCPPKKLPQLLSTDFKSDFNKLFFVLCIMKF